MPPSQLQRRADLHKNLRADESRWGTYRQLPQLPPRRPARLGARRQLLPWLGAALLLASPAYAQSDPSLHARAIAAGYKAAMLCSGIIDARYAGAVRTRESIEANELKGIYPEYDALISSLPAEIQANRVLVRYDPAMPPRIAVSGALLGCTTLPIGTPTSVLGEGIVVRRNGAGGDWQRDESRAPVAAIPSLRPVLDRAFAAGYGAGSNTTAVVVVRDGKILGERYAEGFGPLTPQRTWSVAKSIAGTIIGAAVQKGLLDPNAPAPVPEWQQRGDPRAAITLDNLLRMASGLHSDTAGNRSDAVYFGGTAVTEETVAWPLEVQPGTRFRYANNDILLAVRALRSRIPDDGAIPPRFASDLLFDPVGLDRTFAERDWRGNYILSSQVWSTARDLARLGMFWLADGVWNGRRILPEGWMKYMTTPSGPQPTDGPGYGATMWLFGPKQGLPEGSYAAQGNRGQYVMVIPSRRTIIVRRAEDPGAARFDIARFSADVLAALDGPRRRH